jgi:hypothetical protein
MDKPDDPSTELSMRRTGMSFQRTRMSADRTLMLAVRILYQVRFMLVLRHSAIISMLFRVGPFG